MSEKNSIDLTEVFNKTVEVNKNGEVKVQDGAFKEILAAAGTTETEYKQVKAIDAAIAKTFTQTVADKALPVFKSNPKLEQITAKLPTVGRDSFNVSIDRTAEYTNPQSKEKIVKHGIVTLSHDVIGTRKGEFGAVKKAIAAQWTEALK